MDIRIRPFEISDHPAARALWEASPGVGLSGADEPEAIAAYLRRNPGLSLVAEADDRAARLIPVRADRDASGGPSRSRHPGPACPAQA